MTAVVRFARPPGEFRRDPDRPEDGAPAAAQRIECFKPLRSIGAIGAIRAIHRTDC